jgi:hypothetical protein
MMKHIFAVISLAVLVGCATPPTADPRVAGTSTVQLQERRVELYRHIPRSARRYGSSSQYTTTYTTYGGNLPEQDEIIVIERELNRRYAAGDRAAYFEPQVPYVPPVAQQPGGG